MTLETARNIPRWIERFQQSIPAIEDYFEANSSKVFYRKQLLLILEENREEWKLPASIISASKFLEGLSTLSRFRKIILGCKDYKPMVRYTWGDPTPYAVALSLRPNSYLSHGSAVYLQGLNDQLPKVVYVNKEQSEKPVPEGALSQEALDKAFSHKQRGSQYIFTFKDHQIVILSGKNTQNLEVSTIRNEAGEDLSATKLQRTLIDIAVRPQYAGGVFQVQAAYRSAAPKVQINTIIALLKKLSYKYPYHQAIGFYLEKAGVEASALQRLKALGLDFDFYLDYAIPKANREYDPSWKLFYPKGF